MKFIILVLSFPVLSFASSFPRVDQDLKTFDDKVREMRSSFAATPAAPTEKPWVKLKLRHMRDVDQYMRDYWNTPHIQKYSTDESQYFRDTFLKRNHEIDSRNTEELKDLLKIYSWITISAFDETADNEAWLIVQHADLDPEFQKDVLKVLEKFVLIGETSISNYAYLFDRVAASWKDRSKRQLQRYGTQGTCVTAGKWEPIPMEDPVNVDRRRKAVGLPPEAEYVAFASSHCH